MLLDYPTEDVLREHVVFELMMPWWQFVKTDAYAEWLESRRLLEMSLAAAASPDAMLELNRTRARERAVGGSSWDETKHPRHPAGSEAGGEFMPKWGEADLARLDAQAAADDAHRAEVHDKLANEGTAGLDWRSARAEFDDWAAGMESWYREKDGHPPDYWPTEREELWRRYQDAVVGEGVPLKGRLDLTGVEGVSVQPQLSSASGGDMDVILDPDRELSPDFNVEMPADPAAHESLRPGFTVWTYPDDTPDVIEDIIPLDDTDYFPGGPESKTAQDYTRLLDAAAGRPSVVDPTPVTMYRGMSDREINAWADGEEIPAGKFFTSTPTTAYAQDINAQPPVLQQFRVPRDMLIEVAPGEFQLRKRARMRDGRIEAVTGAGWDESKHPRNPKGSDRGGEFASKGTGVDIRQDLIDHFKEKGVFDPHATADRIMPYGKEYMLSKLKPRSTRTKFGHVTHFRADVELLYPGAIVDPSTGLDMPSLAGRVDADLVYSAPIPKRAGMRMKTKTTVTPKGPMRPLRGAAWEETKHPRHPKGSDRGGEFAPKTSPLMVSIDPATGMPQPTAEDMLLIDQLNETIERARQEEAGTFVRHSDEVVLPDELVDDFTDDYLNEIADDIDFENQDGDPNGIVPDMEEELARAATFKQNATDALDTIAEVHSLPASADRIDLELRPSLGNNTWGSHYAELYLPADANLKPRMKSRYIHLNPTKDPSEAAGTMTHEFGHYVDVQVGDGSQWFSDSEDGAAWRDSVMRSDSVKILKAYRDRDPIYVDYLLGNQELWARSYAQWVALRSGNTKLMESVVEPGNKAGLPERQWGETDFGPIATQIDKIMEPWRE